jgi:hypothetical protein
MSDVQGTPLNGAVLPAVLPSIYSGLVGVSGDGRSIAYRGNPPEKATFPVEGTVGGKAVVVLGAARSGTKGMTRLALAEPYELVISGGDEEETGQTTA